MTGEGSHNSGVEQGVQLKRWRLSRKVNVIGGWVTGDWVAMRVAVSKVFSSRGGDEVER